MKNDVTAGEEIVTDCGWTCGLTLSFVGSLSLSILRLKMIITAYPEHVYIAIECGFPSLDRPSQCASC